MPDADDKLHDLADDPGQDHARADARNIEPWLPCSDIVMLHAPRHAEESHGIKRHERDVEADQPKPEGSLAPAFMKAEAEGFREPVGVSGERAEQHAADD